MKFVLAALLSLSASAALAGPHCPAGSVNVWGACIDEGGRGIFNRIFEGPYQGPAAAPVAPSTGYQSAPHCPPPQLNVWGACVNPTPRWW